MYISTNHARFMRLIGKILILIGNRIIKLYTADKIITIPVEIERPAHSSWFHSQRTIEVKTSCSNS